MNFLLSIVLVFAMSGGGADTQAVLDAHAQEHVQAIAAAGDLFHSDLTPLLAVCGWAGENVGKGPNIERIDRAYLDSPAHAANIAHPRTHSARATTTRAGVLFVADLYCIELEPTPPPPPPAKPAVLPPPVESVPAAAARWSIEWDALRVN